MSTYAYRGRSKFSAVSVYASHFAEYWHESPIGIVRQEFNHDVDHAHRTGNPRKATGKWTAELTAHPGIIGRGKTRDAAVDDVYAQANMTAVAPDAGGPGEDDEP